MTGIQMNGRLCCPLTASEKRQKFFKRLFHVSHMDFEYALWQMLYLFVSPQKVYRNFHYRKQTRNQWARDDPAFLVLVSCVLLASSIAFSVVLGLSFFESIKLILWIVLVDCVLVGAVVASIFWLFANKFLRERHCAYEVEWAYAFDVHLNAFLPLVVILHVVQLPFLYSILYHTWFVSSLLGNTFWLVAVLYYLYITFLGYKALDYLERTNILLSPISIFVIIYLISILTKVNFTVHLADFYKYRIR